MIAVLQQLGGGDINVMGMTMLLALSSASASSCRSMRRRTWSLLGTETFAVRDFVRTGLVLTVIALALVLLLAATYWQLAGLRVGGLP